MAPPDDEEGRASFGEPFGRVFGFGPETPTATIWLVATGVVVLERRERGFDETLELFRRERRRIREEREAVDIMTWEARAIIEALKPHLGV